MRRVTPPMATTGRTRRLRCSPRLSSTVIRALTRASASRRTSLRAMLRRRHPDNTIDWSYFEPISSSPGFWHENHTPYSETWNLSVQRQFGSNTVASVSYVGTMGHKLLSDLESNPGNPALCLSLSQKSQVAPGSPTCGPNGENPGTPYVRADGAVFPHHPRSVWRRLRRQCLFHDHRQFGLSRDGDQPASPQRSARDDGGIHLEQSARRLLRDGASRSTRSITT